MARVVILSAALTQAGEHPVCKINFINSDSNNLVGEAAERASLIELTIHNETCND
jgi:hypothetical protein